jgi:hypothetical protein
MLLRVPPLEHREGPCATRRPGDPAGCTEVGLLVGPDDASVPVFDTTRLHAGKAVEPALEPLRAP